MTKTNNWSHIDSDFEKRLYYVAGKQNIEAIQAILATQSFPGKTLELGCGNGTYSIPIASQADDLYVTDVSTEMIDICKNRLKHLDNVIIEKQDCFKLSYPNETFDSIVMVNLLHVIAEPEIALRESMRVLKKFGKLTIISFTTEGMSIVNKLGMTYRYLRAFGMKPAASSQTLTISKARALLEDEGFVIDEAKLIGVTSKAIFIKASAHLTPCLFKINKE